MENKGKIKSLTNKGFGFISIEGRKDLFFHAKDLVKPLLFDELREGDTVIFSFIDKTDKGEAAREVELA